jgi:hypothetical protein
VPPRQETQSEYPDLYSGESGPTPAILSQAESPLNLFLAFFPRSLFRSIAEESNRYAEQTVVSRARKLRDKQESSGSNPIESIYEIRTRLRERLKVKFEPHEYAVLFGLLIARMLNPRKQRLSTHWSTTSIGALPPGEFGKWMSRQRYEMGCLNHLARTALTLPHVCINSSRFDELMQHLHFSDNKSPNAASDRAWKIRPVIETLQRTFRDAYVPGATLSFDEGTLPSQSKYNGTGMFMKDKPHKWGTKVFLTCCSRTAYCLRCVP